MVIDPKETEERLTKAREVMKQVRSRLGIRFDCRVADYDEQTYKVKISDKSEFIFRSIPRKYFDDKDSWEDHADYWTALFREVEDELNKRR